ncbi:hypothetical protein HN709_00105 [Candidatus Peregrinibacteria bacterium]|jgi:phosphosulfolactate synthase (CoM biosynthesis protein A)|nr:hypothetical protein [Candidatus Peregrinibacteria bacterium]MBT7736074.1 hypothetical protein [Candidatus Peregrinibacteria bacterium]
MLSNRPNYLVEPVSYENLAGTMQEIEPLQIGKIGGVKLPTSLAELLEEKDWKRFQQLCDQYGTQLYLGGGMMDEAIRNGDPFSLVKKLHAAGINTIEISSPWEIDSRKFLEIAKGIREDFDTMLVEIGEKNNYPYSVQWWIRQLLNAEDTGADAIVLEGAGTGEVGIYHEDQSPQDGLVECICERSNDATKLIIESPRLIQQEHWIKTFGPNVKLGNLLATPPLLRFVEMTRTREALKQERAQSKKRLGLN